VSEWGTVIDALEEIARAQWPRLRAGVAGFERDIRPVESLTDAQLPHVFAHSPVDRSTTIAYGQESVEFSVVLLYVPEKSTTQESLAVLLDNFKVALQADPTLGGVVERVWIRQREVIESAVRELKAAALEVVAERTQ
jgi:hypothetical protein